MTGIDIGVLQKQRDLMRRVEQRLADDGFFDPLSYALKNTDRLTRNAARYHPEIGSPVYQKIQGDGSMVIAMADRLSNGAVDPDGCVHFQTWKELKLIDSKAQFVDEFLSGFGARPMTYMLRLAARTLRNFANV